MATSRTRVGRTMLLTAALVLLPLSAFVLVLCLDSYPAWRQFRLTADEYIAPQLEWMRAALTGIHRRGLSSFGSFTGPSAAVAAPVAVLIASPPSG